VGPEVAGISSAAAASRDGERLARVARNDAIHEAAPRAAVEGSEIRPYRRLVQATVSHRRSQDLAGEGFDLHVADRSSARERQSDAKVESPGSGAEGQHVEGRLIHTLSQGARRSSQRALGDAGWAFSWNEKQGWNCAGRGGTVHRGCVARKLMPRPEAAMGSEMRDRLIQAAMEAIERATRSRGKGPTGREIREAATLVVDSVAAITEPATTYSSSYMAVGRPGTGGVSTKPGNVLLDMRKLFPLAANSALAVAGFPAAPWLLPVAAYALWCSLKTAAQVDLTKREGAVIWTMWHNRTVSGVVKSAGLLALVNADLRKYGCPTTNRRGLEISLARLERLGSIAHPQYAPSDWIIRELVQIRWTE